MFVYVLEYILFVAAIVMALFMVFSMMEGEGKGVCVGAFSGAILWLLWALVIDYNAPNEAPTTIQVVAQAEAKVPTEKPMGTQAEYRIKFVEDLDNTPPNPHWAFQKFTKSGWVTIGESQDKAKLENYAQSHMKKVQTPNEVISIEKELKPVLSENHEVTISTVEEL